jgi:hypothetical protein
MSTIEPPSQERAIMAYSSVEVHLYNMTQPAENCHAASGVVSLLALSYEGDITYEDTIL